MTATTRRLISYLSRPLRAEPDAVDALIVEYEFGTSVVRVDNGRLTTNVPSAPSANLDVALADFTLAELAAAINARFGYSAMVPVGADSTRGALTLLDATVTGGGTLQAYRSLIWAYLHAIAVQLDLARSAIADMLLQLRITTAAGEWLDLWRELLIGGRRSIGETDAQQRTRIITTVSRLKSTNLAIQRVVLERTGVAVLIRDLPWYFGDQTLFTAGGPLWSSTQVTNSAAARTPPAALVDASLLADFGLAALPDGRPAAPASAGQALICAFAVIFPDSASCADYCAVMPVVEEFRAGGTLPLTFKSAASASPGDLGVGLLYRAWGCVCDLTADPGDYTQTLIVPSDLQLLPIPYGGIAFPAEMRIVLEGINGIAVPMTMRPGSLFTGMTPKKVRPIGTDVGVGAFGLSSAAVTSMQPLSGNAAIVAVPSDSTPLPYPAIGGLYLPDGGQIRFIDDVGATRTAVLPPETWIDDYVVTQVLETGTETENRIFAFVRLPTSLPDAAYA